MSGGRTLTTTSYIVTPTTSARGMSKQRRLRMARAAAPRGGANDDTLDVGERQWCTPDMSGGYGPWRANNAGAPPKTWATVATPWGASSSGCHARNEVHPAAVARGARGNGHAWHPSILHGSRFLRWPTTLIRWSRRRPPAMTFSNLCLCMRVGCWAYIRTFFINYDARCGNLCNFL
jgi:hypothetical protein